MDGGAQHGQAVELVILGEPASKANSRQLVTNPRNGRPMFIKSAKARAYERSVQQQISPRDPLLTGRLAVTMTIHYATERPDLDASLILDCLEDLIYANDRQVRELHLYHAIDRTNPRAEIRIVPQQMQLALGDAA